MLCKWFVLCKTVLVQIAPTRGGNTMTTTLVPVFLTDEGYDHLEHDLTGVDLGGNKYNLRCVEHHVNIGIVSDQNN